MLRVSRWTRRNLNGLEARVTGADQSTNRPLVRPFNMMVQQLQLKFFAEQTEEDKANRNDIVEQVT